MKTFFASLWSGIKSDFKVEDDNIVWLLLGCFSVTLFIFLSFFSTIFSYFALVFCLGIGVVLNIRKKNTYASLPLLFYLLPFSMVFNLPNLSISLFSIIASLQAFAMFVQWIFQVVRKEIRISWFVLVPFLMFVLYVTALFCFKRFSISTYLSIVIGASICFEIATFSSKIDSKEIVLFYVGSLLISSFLGLFRTSYPNLKDFYSNIEALGHYRFTALFPNTNAFTLYTLFGIAMLFVIYFKKEFSVVFFPCLFLLLIISYSTLSKMTLLVLLVLFVIIVIQLLIKLKTKAWKSIVLLVCCIGLSIVCSLNSFTLTFQRLKDPFLNQTNQAGEYTHNDGNESENVNLSDDEILNTDNNSANTESLMNEFTTGRTAIWKKTIKNVFSTYKTALFGCLTSAEDVDSNGNLSPHNTYLQVLYYIGIVGFCLLSLFILSLFLFVKKCFDMSGFIYFFCLGMCFAALDVFSYIGFIFFSLTTLFFHKKGKEINKEEQQIDT